MGKFALTTVAALRRAGPASHLGSITKMTLLVETQVNWTGRHENRRTDPSPLICHVVAWVRKNCPSSPHPLLHQVNLIEEREPKHGPRCGLRSQTSSSPSMTRGASDSSADPDYGRATKSDMALAIAQAHIMPWLQVVTHINRSLGHQHRISNQDLID